MKLFNKKGNLGNLQALALGVGVFAIVIAVVLTVLSQMMGATGLAPEAVDAINTSLVAIAGLPTWIPIIVICVVGVVIISIVTGGFGMMGR